MQSHDIVIIGAGPGGVAAAAQCKRLGHTPVLLDQTGTPGGLARDAFCIENYPGIGPTGGAAFAKLLSAHLRRFKLGVTKGEVQRIEPDRDGLIVHLADTSISSRAVIVAVGTTPLPLHIAGTDCVSYSPRPAIDRNCEAVFVVGGGEAALDYALSLSSAGMEVKILIRGTTLRARGRLAELVSLNPRIEMWRDTQVREVRPVSGGLQVTLSQGTATWEEQVDEIVVAVGRESAARYLLKGLDVGPDKTVSTRISGLFLVGDARTGSLGQAGMAVGDGLAAAMAAARMLEES